MDRTGPAVEAIGLRKRYGDRVALDGLDLAVRTGSVHGLLGPNGAGKTTAMRILSTLARPDGGRATVAGRDVVGQAEAVRARIGLVGQHAAVDEVLSGRQNLVMFGRLHHLGIRQARRRADELLEDFGLADTGCTPVAAYSGGMRRRLDLAAAMIVAPSVLFLDEPTTGLDPRSRTQVWHAVRSLAGTGTTVLLTTQYLEEADQLADHITVIDHGRAIADADPATLKSELIGDRVDVVVTNAADLPRAAQIIGTAAGGPTELDPDTRKVSAAVPDHTTTRTGALTSVLRALDQAAITADDIAVRRPTLEEVFLRLTAADSASPRH